jgi:hypothetical protein
MEEGTGKNAQQFSRGTRGRIGKKYEIFLTG